MKKIVMMVALLFVGCTPTPTNSTPNENKYVITSDPIEYKSNKNPIDRIVDCEAGIVIYTKVNHGMTAVPFYYIPSDLINSKCKN